MLTIRICTRRFRPRIWWKMQDNIGTNWGLFIWPVIIMLTLKH
jgi:hypothetical protein